MLNKTIFILTMTGGLASPVWGKISTGSIPKEITIAGDDGGRTDGNVWSSSMLKDKVWAMFYVDPDEKDANGKMEEALAAAKLPENQFGSVAIINMDASWLPNSILASALEEKQKKYPQTVYVKDMKKILVKEWGLEDDSYSVLIFSPAGKLVYSKDGTLSADEIKKMLDVIKANLPTPDTKG